MEIGFIKKLSDKKIAGLKKQFGKVTHQKYLGLVDTGPFGMCENWQYITIKKARTWKDCQEDPRVDEAWTEGGQGIGDIDYWVCLKDGWIKCDNPQRTLHEWTVNDICRELNSAVEGQAN
jgi:hypothetical protein